MPALALPDPPLSDGVVALRGFDSRDVPAIVGLSLAIVDAADTARLLGSIALHPIDWRLGAADVGYWLAAPARGRGQATRAVRLVAGWAFDTLGLERLELRAQRGNHASQAVAARAGFRPVATPVVLRPECDHRPHMYFARLRGS